MKELTLEGSMLWEAPAFYFESGRKYRIIAPSGMGKTSLLAMMYGLRSDYSGDLFLDDQNARSLNSKEWSVLRKRKLSMIFQGLELFDDLTARQNIRVKNGITGFKSEREIAAMAAQLGIERFLDRRCEILSFGQKQRVAIIRSLCQPFEYLFADECFSHMDHQNSQSAFDLISGECAVQGAGLVLTSLENTPMNGFDTTITL